MLISTALFASFLVVALYLCMVGWVYRRPWVLLSLGIGVAWVSVILKTAPIFLKAAPKLAPTAAAELELAAAVVDLTLIGLAGGLIASAFISKLQFAHEKEIAAARETLLRALKRMGDSERADEDLRLVAASLSDDEFRTRLRKVQNAKLDAFSDKWDAEEALRRLDTTDV